MKGYLFLLLFLGCYANADDKSGLSDSCPLILNSTVLASVTRIPRTADDLRQAVACLNKGQVIKAKTPESEVWEDLYQKHGHEFGALNIDDYERKAKTFASSLSPQALSFAGPRTKAIFKYNPATDEMMVVSSSGVIQTYYKTRHVRHRYSTGFEHFLSQYARY
ncbi:MAG: hypothetical protein HY537_01080 [Deltaproteobacteria bacterium]|nr:hypothetical protein [Deltaproteobacteria bacterium]